ncbi:hypothetical protein GNIT_3534 [Glaciecola nitratireducens FR1064]|uniref:Uncharacterized protein n=1 Tax=Glaciecola nitratireducens (strain JCM 12485 / KCTC 12276 / FR1064) TaxID=1085623 RepID=G4QNS0_GLANF|nr:hypothetical protein GNIT_3534 [Glaciecola nitratireducens FR1064]
MPDTLKDIKRKKRKYYKNIGIFFKTQLRFEFLFNLFSRLVFGMLIALLKVNFNQRREL